MGAVGLPGPDHVGRAQMERVALAVAAHQGAQPAEARGVKGLARRRQVQGGLDEAAVVFEADLAGETQTGAAVDHVGAHAGLGDAAHDPVAHAAPPGAQAGDQVPGGEIVDQHGVIRPALRCRDQGKTRARQGQQARQGEPPRRIGARAGRSAGRAAS